MPIHFKPVFDKTKYLIGKTIGNAISDDVPLHGAAIAFYTIFSVAPFFIILLYFSQILLSEVIVRQQLFAIITDYTGPEMAHSLRVIIESYSQSVTAESNLFAGLLSVLIPVFGATTAISQLKASLNIIWNVQPGHEHVLYTYFWDRAISFFLVIAMTLLFLAVLLMEVLLPTVLQVFHMLIPVSLESFLLFGLPLSSAIATYLFFYLLLGILPDKKIPRREIMAGALLTTGLFMVGKYIVLLYLGNPSVQLSFRAAGSFVVFLIWVYYNIQIFLLGAEFTIVYAERHETENYPG